MSLAKSCSFEKILVPIDGSEYSKRVLLSACKIANAFDSKIILVYVVEKSFPLNLLDRKEYLNILRQFGKKSLDTAVSMISKKKKGITADIFLKEGNIVT